MKVVLAIVKEAVSIFLNFEVNFIQLTPSSIVSSAENVVHVEGLPHLKNVLLQWREPLMS
jgi:hypothetical protein